MKEIKLFNESNILCKEIEKAEKEKFKSIILYRMI